METGPLGRDNRYVLEVYNAIAEHRTYPINFKDWCLCIPPPPKAPKESNQSAPTQQCIEHLLKVCCESGPKLIVDSLDELVLDTFAKATRNGSAFKWLSLTRDGQLSDSFIDNISSIVNQSELTLLEIYTKEDKARERILESIHWEHLRQVYISMKPGTFETSMMRVLVDGVKKASGKVHLDGFQLWSEERDIPLTLPQGDLLQDFIASTSIERLELKVNMTLEQIPPLLASADVSRLKILTLWSNDFDSVKVNAVLDGLQHAKKLEIVTLPDANITKKQKSRMRKKGIILQQDWSLTDIGTRIDFWFGLTFWIVVIWIMDAWIVAFWIVAIWIALCIAAILWNLKP